MRTYVFYSLALTAALGLPAVADADTARSEPVRGITFTEEIQGNGSSLGFLMKFDTALGYQFNRHISVEGGFPVYMVNPSSSLSSAGAQSHTGLGDAYGDVRISFANKALDYMGIVTVGAPTGDRSIGFSTGHASWDWSNVVDRTFSRVTPFADLGIGNTILDQPYFIRPYTTFGFVGHLEGGALYKLRGIVSVGGSAYAIEPAGQQTVISRVIGGAGRRVSSTGLAQDHGVSVWLDVKPPRYAQFEIGYSHSVDYSLDSVFFDVIFSLGSLIPKHF